MDGLIRRALYITLGCILPLCAIFLESTHAPTNPLNGMQVCRFRRVSIFALCLRFNVERVALLGFENNCGGDGRQAGDNADRTCFKTRREQLPCAEVLPSAMCLLDV